MRKTPLSAPGGSTKGKPYDWNSRNRRYSHNGAGYANSHQFKKHECIVPNQDESSPQTGEKDFIPLGFSSPVNQYSRNNGAWRGSGNGYHHHSPAMGGGHNFSGNNSYDTPKSRFNNSNSSQFGNKQRYGQRKSYQKDHRREADISSYLNVQATMEDPWADLMQKFNESRSSESPHSCQSPRSPLSVESAEVSQIMVTQSESSQEQSNETTCSTSSNSCASILIGDLTVKSNNSQLNVESPELVVDNVEAIPS